MEEAWRRLGGNVAEEAMTSARPSDAASGQALARRLPARRRRSSRLSLYRCSYFRWKTSRQRAPANAIGTPIRAGKLYPNPIATGIPPRKAPTALPRLKAAWMQQPPSISPPSACFTIRNCSGDPMPKRQTQQTNISTTETQPMGARKKVSRRAAAARNWR